jgi:hypothetical protein
MTAFDESGPCRTAGFHGRPDEPIFYGRAERVLSTATALACRANRGRTQKARELRHAAIQYMAAPLDSQTATARRLGITARRFRQILSEMREIVESETS